jgi:hypothetical protein
VKWLYGAQIIVQLLHNSKMVLPYAKQLAETVVAIAVIFH